MLPAGAAADAADDADAAAADADTVDADAAFVAFGFFIANDGFIISAATAACCAINAAFASSSKSSFAFRLLFIVEAGYDFMAGNGRCLVHNYYRMPDGR
jgi:hypothetical protein